MKHLSKERLEQLAVEDDLYNYPPTQEELNTMARALLAGIAQEPVAYADPQAFINFQAGTAKKEWMWCRPCPDLRPLYAAPPAPVVPDDLLSSMDEVLRISDRDHEAWHRAKAAMDILKQAAPNMLADEALKDPGGALCGKRKSDAWIPCSERMPDDDHKVLLMVKSLVVDYVCLADFSHDTWWDEHDRAIPTEHATHWQPLPAPPKDEK